MSAKFMMLCGLPGCGKSTFSNKLVEETNAVVCSSDALRLELFGSEDEQTQNNRLFAELGRRVKMHLQNGQNVIYDATNINAKKRMAFLREIKHIKCEKICYVLATPLEVCFRNNRSRERFVPEHSIRRMQMTWTTPGCFEGWDRIEVVYPFPEYKGYLGKPEAIAASLVDFSQDNPHHTLTLGNHLKACQESVIEQLTNAPELDRPSMREAALIHDLGKRSTKGFFNTKGEPTKIAHYYQHENVGAYEALFLDVEDPLEVSLLVNLHMKPYTWENGSGSEKTAKRYQEMWGETLYRKVMILHKADGEAH